ncbi:MAG: PIN domain-containing protein [Anaerolineae bacterium]|nr:PIN domain-containing protein [Phycisphaerae bacterium]
MMLLDVNVLVNAFRPDMPAHAATKQWLDHVLRNQQACGFVDAIACGFVRVVTQPTFQTPLPAALDFIDRLRGEPSFQIVAPNSEQWSIFDQICRSSRRRGGDIQDAYWASFAIYLDCPFITFDRGFSTVPGLRWRSPIETQARTNPR